MDIWDILFKFLLEGKDIDVTHMKTGNISRMQNLFMQANHRMFIQQLEKNLEQEDFVIEKKYKKYNIVNGKI